MEVFEFTLGDIAELHALQPAGWPDITPNFNHYITSASCSPLKFCIENRIVGIGAAIAHKNSCWLGHIIVHPDFRNQGIGRFITETLCERMSAGFPTISLIATDMGERHFT